MLLENEKGPINFQKVIGFSKMEKVEVKFEKESYWSFGYDCKSAERCEGFNGNQSLKVCKRTFDEES